MTAALEVEKLVFAYGAAQVLRGVSLAIAPGECVAVVGPNGAGKSTFLGVAAGLRKPYRGHCRVLGREVAGWPKPELARRAAFIPQSVRLDFPFLAKEVVYMGRTPHCRGLFESEADRRAVERALELTDAAKFAEREFAELSGGEKQRVVLASALAQEPELLLLDEPTTFLDLKHQTSIYALLKRLAGEGVAVVAVTHDLNLAGAYCDRVIVIADGQVAADGPPAAALAPEVVRRVFETEVTVVPGPGGKPWLTYGC